MTWSSASAAPGGMRALLVLDEQGLDPLRLETGVAGDTARGRTVVDVRPKSRR
jgi:hypothetical protein